ncbi:hypothetical protein LINPERHAP2_LOCUS37076 [Linum perenne]
MKQLPVAIHNNKCTCYLGFLKHDNNFGSKMEFNMRMYKFGSLSFLLFGMGGIGKNHYFGPNIICKKCICYDAYEHFTSWEGVPQLYQGQRHEWGRILPIFSNEHCLIYNPFVSANTITFETTRPSRKRKWLQIREWYYEKIKLFKTGRQRLVNVAGASGGQGNKDYYNEWKKIFGEDVKTLREIGNERWMPMRVNEENDDMDNSGRNHEQLYSQEDTVENIPSESIQRDDEESNYNFSPPASIQRDDEENNYNFSPPASLQRDDEERSYNSDTNSQRLLRNTRSPTPPNSQRRDRVYQSSGVHPNLSNPSRGPSNRHDDEEELGGNPLRDTATSKDKNILKPSEVHKLKKDFSLSLVKEGAKRTRIPTQSEIKPRRRAGAKKKSNPAKRKSSLANPSTTANQKRAPANQKRAPAKKKPSPANPSTTANPTANQNKRKRAER